MTHFKPFWLLLAFITFSKINFAQQFIGLGTGNYGGVTSISLNPSSIADSRHKFDINLFSINSYFDNNLVNIKRDAVYRGLFFKEPYNSDYAAVRRDLLSLQSLPASERVNGLSSTRIQAPFSAMITTGKKSAIGITFQSRAGLQAFNMARNTAQLLYEELNNPKLHGFTENNNGFESNHLRWQEVGFTYARVLVNSGAHFLKAGVTGKWLMGQASAYIQSDNVNVTFNSQTELSLQSPLIRYYRSEQADFNQFNTTTFFKDIEDHGFGWDAGITYEFRGNFDKFRFAGLDDKMLERRDMNKYSIRLAAAIMDAGKLQFAKMPLTNDHSANFMNWNFMGVRAQSFNDFDTAYARQVEYSGGSGENFTVAMPTALSANIDLRIHRGFYLNGSMYKPLRNFNNNTQSGLRPVEWFAVTPRFESRAFGIYVPITMTNLHERTAVGLTLRAGPLFIGSNNLGNYLFNKQVPSADVHAGLKIGITYGKPSKLMKSIEKLRLSAMQKDSLMIKDSLLQSQAAFQLEENYKRAIDSLIAFSDSITLRNTILAEFSKADSLKKQNAADKPVPAVNIIINNYLPANRDTVKRSQSNMDTLVINNRLPISSSFADINAVNAKQLDSILRQKEGEVEFLLRQNAQQSLLLNDFGTLRKEDSVMLIQLQEDRKRLETILTDSLVKWEREFNPAPTVVPAEKRERRSIFKRNRDNVNRAQPSQSFLAMPNVLYKRDLGFQQRNAEVRTIQKSNSDLELEMQSLRRSMAATTAMMNQSMAANNAAMQIGVQGSAQDTPVAVVRVAPLPVKLPKADTIFVRDTIFLPGLPVASMPMNVVNPVFIRDTTIIEKMISVDRVPEEVSVFFASGSKTLSLNAKKMLEKWSHLGSTIHTANEVHLMGRTDATGSEAINRRVAQNRINTVTQYLIAHGINKENITSSMTLAPKSASASNPLNRRVDVKMISLAPLSSKK